MIDLKKVTVRWNLDHYVPKKIHGFLSKPMDGTPLRAASLFLKQNFENFKISAQRKDLRYNKTSARSWGLRGPVSAAFQAHADPRSMGSGTCRPDEPDFFGA